MEKTFRMSLELLPVFLIALLGTLLIAAIIASMTPRINPYVQDVLQALQTVPSSPAPDPKPAAESPPPAAPAAAPAPSAAIFPELPAFRSAAITNKQQALEAMDAFLNTPQAQAFIRAAEAKAAGEKPSLKQRVVKNGAPPNRLETANMANVPIPLHPPGGGDHSYLRIRE